MLMFFMVDSSLASPPSASDPLHLSWRDTSVSPGDNFYAYANRHWQQQNPIPPEFASWSVFSLLEQKNINRIHHLLKTALKNNPSVGSIEQKVGDFYFSGMDEKTINQVGIDPLQSEFKRIAMVTNQGELQKTIANLHLMGVNVFFDFDSMQDYRNSKKMIAVAMQGGLSLPDRDYYLKDNAKFKNIREAFLAHVTRMFCLLGDTAEKARLDAQLILRLETRLAEASLSQIEQRDPSAVYHIKNLTQLKQSTPHFSWSDYFLNMGQPRLKSINLAMPLFFQKMDALMVKTPLDELKTYMRWHLLSAYAPYLSQPYVEENFRLLSALTGTKKMLSRWRRVVNTENQALGFAIGKLYVEAYFSPAQKKDVLTILTNIRHALEEDLEHLPWMTAVTKKAALRKLAMIEERVGYPNKWWDYSDLLIDKGPYVLNILRVNRFLIKRELAKIGKPIDRSEWSMTPQTINAYYDPSMNNINLPAGILQAPFFDPAASDAANYGAIGFVIGHELTHGFDDQGARFDGQGNLNNWWTPKDLQAFKAATRCIEEQFSQYKIEDDGFVQGKLVVGEATADLGGLTLAYRAFRQSPNYQETKTIDGLTPLQQFFLASAHIWASNMRPEQLRQLITIDPHPPMVFRVNGTLANMPSFQEAFSISDDKPMVNKARCVIW